MKKIIHYVLILSALIPATVLFVTCIIVIAKLIGRMDFDIESLFWMLSCVFGVFGYLGLIFLLLKQNENRMRTTRIFLILGIFSFIIFNSIGGLKAWKWFLTIEEPDEWFILGLPVLISIYFVRKKIKQLTTIKNQ